MGSGLTRGSISPLHLLVLSRAESAGATDEISHNISGYSHNHNISHSAHSHNISGYSNNDSAHSHLSGYNNNHSAHNHNLSGYSNNLSGYSNNHSAHNHNHSAHNHRGARRPYRWQSVRSGQRSDRFPGPSVSRDGWAAWAPERARPANCRVLFLNRGLRC
ncbi:unnamed protein product [Lampetra planeri]